MGNLITIAGAGGGSVEPPPAPTNVEYVAAPPRPEGLTYG